MKRKKMSYAKYGYFFCIPFAVAFLLFQLYPIVFTLIIGFTDLKTLPTNEWHFLDDLFGNFKKVLGQETFWTAFGNTWLLWITNFIPQIVLALLLAAIFTDNRSKIKGQGFFKVVFYMPNIITAATIAVLFTNFFGYPKGPVNDLFHALGITAPDDNIFFFQNKTVARGVVSFIQFWMWYGYSMIVFISGILGISPEIFEAAEVDGASRTQQFFHVTLPNIKTIMLFSLVTSLIGGLQMFDIPHLLVSKNGPSNATLTASCYIYNKAFDGKHFYGQGAAASMFMFLIIAILASIMFYVMRDKDEAKLNKLMRQQTKEYKKAQKALKGGN